MTNERELSSVGTRFLALLVDWIILIIPSVASQFVIPFLGPVLIGILYQPILEASALQATIGKKLMGIMVTDTNGGRLTLGMACLRYLVACGSMCVLFIGHFFAFFTAKKQALHDLVADSVVVKGGVDGVKIFDAWMDVLRRLFGIAEKRLSGLTEKDSNDRLRELERLHDLKIKGALSEEEYQRMKSKLMQD